MVDLKALNLHGVSPTMLILSESTQNVHHFGASPITTVFIVEEIRVIEFYPDLQYSQPPSHICMGCHQQCEDHLKVHGKGSILVQVLSQQQII